MVYNRLKTLLTKNKKKVKDAAKIAGYAENSFKVAVEDGTMSFSKVPILCEFIGITPNEFFGWESTPIGGGNYASHISGGNTQNSNEVIQALMTELKEKTGIIKEKDKQINRLLTIIERNKFK
ncbi:MAG: hypothetical protein K5893_12720 [Prevotella sp.]|nr:hypothetical protein [Prevotella sp.]